MHKKFTAQFQGDSLKATLMRGGLVSIFIKIIGLILSLATAIVLARVLGPEQYGIYSYALAIVSVLAIPAMFGLPTLVVRETAKAEAAQNWGVMRGLWQWSNKVTGSIALIITASAALILWLKGNQFSQVQVATFAWGIIFIPLASLASLRGAALRGLRKVIQGQLPELVIKPALFILLILVFALGNQIELTASGAMMLNMFSAGIAFLFGAWLLMKAKPKDLRTAKEITENRKWLLSAAPLALVAGVDVLVTETDTIMLGLFRPVEEVGIYRVASQGAMLAILGVTAANMVIAPYISRFFQSHDIENLKKIVIQSARFSFAIGLIVTLTFGFWGKEIIVLVFGDAYIEAYWPLLLLCIGQCVHAGMGAGGVILNMSGFEKDTLFILALSAMLNVLLNFMWIPSFGVIGAGMATATAIVFRKIVAWFMVYRRLKIDSSIIGYSPKVIA